MREQDEIVGIVFSLSQEHIRRFFDEGKTVFVKFAASQPTHLNIGSRLFFYQSKSRKEIVGEARIIKISSDMPDTVLATYGDQLFLTPNELREYVGERSSKKMLVLVLDKVKRYSVPIKLVKPLTMAGQYMTKMMYIHRKLNKH